jgi:RimJ/RimL family protein N-acetyltransferase
MGRSLDTTSPLRALHDDDLAALRAHLLRLDPASRRSRFAMAADDDFLTAYAASLMGPVCFVLGWFDGDDMRAAGELRLIEDRVAEVAFSVEPEWRGRGIGTMLLRRLADDSRSLGVRRLYMSCLAENVAMQALARKCAADLVFDAPEALSTAAKTSSEVDPDLAQVPDFNQEYATAIMRVGPPWMPSRWRRA